jgi:uncharacterized protein (TIGR03067 family)
MANSASRILAGARWQLALGLAAILALGSGVLRLSAAPLDDKAKTDVVKALQGEWTSEENAGLESKWNFEGDVVKTMVAGMDYSSRLTVDPEAKPHPTMDLMIEDGPEDSKGKTSKGIYKLEGDKLTICVSVPGKDRPKDFEQVEDECYLFQLKKEKK